MATYTYPSNGYEQAQFLLGLFGSHWTNVYQGNNLVERYGFARAQEELQAHQDLLETVASLSRLEVPIYHTDNWYWLVIRESELNSLVLAYGDGAVYGVQPSGDSYEYGEAKRVSGYQFPIPDELKDVKTIVNRLTAPSLTLTRGNDFALTPTTITFATNPFTDDRVAKRDIVEGTTIVDREAGLWLFKGQFDWGHVYTHFGYVLGLYLESSSNYRDFVNAILDAIVGGTSCKDIQLALAAVTGIPPVQGTEEVVELIQPDTNHLVIATDLNVYKFPLDTTPTVTVGDVVYAGDQLVDVITFYELNQGLTPSDVSAVTMGLGYLPGGFADGITFYNADRPLIVTTVDGVTKVSFELGGLPTDVDLFWDMVHERGLATLTFARYLDVRGQDAETEPTAASLPATINPLHFLIENILRYNAFIVKIKANRTAARLAFANLRLLRKIVPPWTAIILLFELDVADDPVMLVDEGTETTPGYTESVVPFTGMAPVEESIIPSSYAEELVTVYLVNGVCR